MADDRLLLPPDGCHGHARRIGALVFGEVIAPAHRETRTARSLVATDPDIELILPRHGRCLVGQDGRRAALGAGDFAILELSRPHTMVFETACLLHVVLLPRRAVRLSGPGMAALTATRLSSTRGPGALLPPLLAGIAAESEALGLAQALRTADTIADLITSVLAGGNAESLVAQSDMLVTVKSYLERHLDDPDISPRAAAAAAHISVGYLHKLFRAEGTTVCGWIRRRRLEHCRRDLTDPDAFGLSVNTVCARWGFVDAAHFSKLFKSAYGVAPREYRILHGSGNWPGNR